MIFIKVLKKIQTMFFSIIAYLSLDKNNRCFLIVNHFTWLGHNCMISHNCNFNGMRVSGYGKLTIGENFHSGKNCKIITSNHNYEGELLPYDSKIINKDVVIGNNVWIGDNVIILPGVIVEEGAIIQAGSVVCGRIKICEIAGGNPCKMFKMRNIDHYNQLKKGKKFF